MLVNERAAILSLAKCEQALHRTVGPLQVSVPVAGSGPMLKISSHTCLSTVTHRVQMRNIAVTRPAGSLESRWSGKVFLLMIERGVIHSVEEGNTYESTVGDVLLINPVKQNIIWTEDQATFLSMSIPHHELAGVRLLERLTGVISVKGCIGKGQLLSLVMRGFAAEAAADLDEGASVAGRTLLLNLFRDALTEQEQNCRSADDELLLRMHSWMMARLPEHGLWISDLAKAFAMSERGLYRLFARNETTPERWLQAQQLEHARVMLEATSYQIGVIAYGAGFADASHFTRQFRQTYGMTPSAYRRLEAPAS